ncbi:HNH endonuclease signature motif containing protein [Paenirhodobacter hankyongi]|uniref:Putative HNH nuclease YajD n=1 Tax=Paenirhodobacter hankyongi TaxID=2294033 RepID=A0A421BN14_9RHOB|nr:HNH endonuclease [Sinirhodobacter hankyongi]RLL64296.1 HNH endonuclease [Sinirhodobacter hankyongi]
MPRPPHICTCGRLVAHGARCACQIASTRARNRRHDAKRPSARERGYTTDWQKERKAFLAAHPDCAMCGAPATVVDHIIPHRGNKALFWDRHNWQPLCAPCHNRHKQREERASHVVGT